MRCEAAGEAARDRGVLGAVRPGPHLRQPLRVLLHLPAAEGDAAQPLPEGRRLPAVLPLRELHHPDPLHRARPRAGRSPSGCRRCSSPSTATDPELRARMLRNPHGAPPACAGCGPCSTAGSRCTARSWCARGQRRRRPRDDAGRHRRRVPRAGHRGVRAARGERLHRRSRPCAHTPRPRPAP